jgi:hypothetical protein
MIDISRTPAIVLGIVGAYIAYRGISFYVSITDGLLFVPELVLFITLLLGGGFIAISIRSVQKSDPDLPLALIVGFAVAYGVGVSQGYFVNNGQALYLWAFLLSGPVATGITLYFLRGVEITKR